MQRRICVSKVATSAWLALFQFEPCYSHHEDGLGQVSIRDICVAKNNLAEKVPLPSQKAETWIKFNKLSMEASSPLVKKTITIT